MSKKILQVIEFGDPLLREQAKPVTVFHYKLHALINSISETLYHREDGAALAANQVGVLKKITVIDYEGEYIEMVNPEIIEADGSQTDEEGCLSFPGYYGKVTRSERIKVVYFDRDGKENVIERKDKMARCIQHEIDHLNGILFIDRMDGGFVEHVNTKERIPVEEVRMIAGVPRGTFT